MFPSHDLWGREEAITKIFTTHSGNGIEVKGTSSGSNSWSVDSVTFKGFQLEADGVSGDGFFVDGSQADNSNRDFARALNFTETNVLNYDGYGYHFKGNVFDINFNLCGARNNDLGNFKATESTSIGTNRPKQLYLWNCFSWSKTNTWAYDFVSTQTVSMFGGFVQGKGNGVRTGFNFSIWGTHIEGEGEPEDDSIGLDIQGRYNLIYPADIAGYKTGINIDSYNYRGIIPFLDTDNTFTGTTIGVNIESGGNRKGTIEILDFGSNVDTRFNDQRGLAEFRRGLFSRENRDGVYLPPPPGS